MATTDSDTEMKQSRSPPPPPHHHRHHRKKDGAMEILSHNHFHGTICISILAIIFAVMLCISIALNIYLLWNKSTFMDTNDHQACDVNIELMDKWRELADRISILEQETS